MTHPDHITAFTKVIWDWYSIHKRTLPWRDLKIKDDTQRAYMVLVSEVMLQQTQVPRVIIIFKRFLEQFPTIEDLAKASNKDVILAWRGMGYNSRALRLRDAALSVHKNYNSRFPRHLEALLSIKGIGPYTAAAILNFAFNQPTPCIDTNIRRIIHRTFIGPENPDGTWSTSDKKLLPLVEEILAKAIDGSPEHDAANWHAALMDFGSLVQTKNNPKWDICPLTEKGLMKATPSNWKAPIRGAAKEKEKREPGRIMAGRYIPNRIFRGRIVESLRDAPDGLPFETIGREICIDWAQEHRKWLKSLLKKLIDEKFIDQRRGKFQLRM